MRRLALTLIVSAAGMVLVSSAQARRFHGGAGLGYTFFSSDLEKGAEGSEKVDENATAWKVFGGFSSGTILGLEGGYRSFGSVETTLGGGSKLESSTTGWDIAAMIREDIFVIDIFGKAGVIFWSTDTKLGSSSDDSSGTDFFWGLGAGVHLGPIGARLEWERAEVESVDNLSMLSLSATLGFWTHETPRGDTTDRVPRSRGAPPCLIRRIWNPGSDRLSCGGQGGRRARRPWPDLLGGQTGFPTTAAPPGRSA